MTSESVIVGAGCHDWVWVAIASGDIHGVRAAPANFDINSIHPKYGSVLIAFLQSLLNVEGCFVETSDKGKLTRDLVNELGRRGARPDVAMPCANIRIRGLWKDWRLTGDITPMHAVSQMRNDLLAIQFEPPSSPLEGENNGALEDGRILSSVVDIFSQLISTSAVSIDALQIPAQVVDVWERCFDNSSSGDLAINCSDGVRRAHSLLLTCASPVLAAMLVSGMQEDKQRCIRVDETVRVVTIFLRLLYTGCLSESQCGKAGDPVPELEAGTRVVVEPSFISNSSRSVLLAAGMRGKVHVVDHVGDALVLFEGLSTRQWVMRKNFCRLRQLGDDEDECHIAGVYALSRRWQVDGLGDVLEHRLARSISLGSFVAAAEVAELGGAGHLKTACVSFAHNHPTIRAQFDDGNFPPATAALLHELYGPENARKRARIVV